MFKSLHIENIGPISKLQLSGLDLLRSPILVLGSNRIGKSTLLDSLAFVLCGEFPSKGGSIYNRVKSGCDVGKIEVELVINDRLYKIMREITVSRRKTVAKVYYNGKMIVGPSVLEVDKFIIENIIDPNLMLMTNFGSQFKRGDFVAMEPANRKKYLSELLGLKFGEELPKFQALKKSCDEECSQLQTIISTLAIDQDAPILEAELSSILSTISSLKTQIEDIKKSEEELSKDYNVLQADTTEYNNNHKRYSEINKMLLSVSEIEEKFGIDLNACDVRKLLADKKVVYNMMSDDKRRISAELSQMKLDKVSYDQTVREYSQSLARYKNDVSILNTVPCHGEGEFAGCQFLMNAQRAVGKIAEMEQNVPEQKTFDTIDLENQVKTLETSILDCNSLISAIENNPALLLLEDYNKELYMLRSKLTQDICDALQLRKEAISEKVASLSAQKTIAQNSLSVVMEQKGRCEASLENIKKNEKTVKQSKEKLSTLALEQKALEAIVTGFGVRGVAPLLLELAVPEICTIANSLLDNITESSLHVELQTVKSVNKGKEFRETLVIEVSAADGRVGDVLEFSGAEQNMVTTAIRCALTVFNIRSGKGLKFLALDEPFGSYDSHHNEKVMNMFVGLASLIPQVFLISHQQETFGLAGSVIDLYQENGILKYNVV